LGVVGVMGVLGFPPPTPPPMRLLVFSMFILLFRPCIGGGG
jgi:hypothetical protein